MQGTVLTRIHANIISSLEGIDGSAAVSTTVDQNSASGQKVLYVASTTGLTVGDWIQIADGTAAREEVGRIASIDTGVSVTLETNLEFTHTFAQADTVKEDWYNYSLDNVLSWNEFNEGMFITKGAYASARSTGEQLRGHYSNHENQTHIFECAIIAQGEDYVSRDQNMDRIYQELIADFVKAIHADHSRGGHAENTRIVSHSPVTAEDFENLNIDNVLPMVGAVFQVAVEYSHRTGNAYA